MAVLCAYACTSCAPPPKPAIEPPPALRARIYDCEGSEAMLQQVSSDRIQLHLPSRSVLLPHVRSASGAKYSSGGTTFWIKGPTALLELPAAKRVQCEEDRPSSLREDARARGVHYRGLGNEPGWQLEIGPTNITFDYDYGEHRVVVPLQEPQIGPEGRLSYDQATSTQRLRVTIEASTCLDAMTGAAFDQAVEVTLDGRTFRGCGNALR